MYEWAMNISKARTGSTWSHFGAERGDLVHVKELVLNLQGFIASLKMKDQLFFLSLTIFKERSYEPKNNVDLFKKVKIPVHVETWSNFRTVFFSHHPRDKHKERGNSPTLLFPMCEVM